MLKMEKGIKTIIYILGIITALQFGFFVGYIFGEVNTAVALSTYLEVKDNTTQEPSIIYINETCNYDKRDITLAKQDMLIEFYNKGYLTSEDLLRWIE